MRILGSCIFNNTHNEKPPAIKSRMKNSISCNLIVFIEENGNIQIPLNLRLQK